VLLATKRLDGWNALFLAGTVATSVTGFGFPLDHWCCRLWSSRATPFTSPALDAGSTWVGGVGAIYFNVFVGIVQAFQKAPALKAMAPTQSEPPFLLTQIVVMALFVALAIVTAIKFRPRAAPSSGPAQSLDYECCRTLDMEA
jgi:hypothetical protein